MKKDTIEIGTVPVCETCGTKPDLLDMNEDDLTTDEMFLSYPCGAVYSTHEGWVADHLGPEYDKYKGKGRP